jgi:succinoglycan biosynthesis protein ExoV
LKLWYPEGPIENFGDDLNLWLWPRLLPGAFDEDARIIFIGIGTILGAGLPQAPLKVVLGAGGGYNEFPVPDERWRFYAVRGPLTAAALGIDASLAATDPGSMVGRELARELGPAPSPTGVAFMPHNGSVIRAEMEGWDLGEVCRRIGVTYISGKEPVDEVLATLRGSRLLVTEAMHGAIVADGMRVPWVPVRVFQQVLGFKWDDWCASLGLTYEPLLMDAMASPDAPTELAALIERAQAGRSFLSSDAALHGALGKLDAAAGSLRDDLASGALEQLATRLGAGQADQSRLEKRAGWSGDVMRRWTKHHESVHALLEKVPRSGSFVLLDGGAWGLGQEVAGRRIVRLAKDAGARGDSALGEGNGDAARVTARLDGLAANGASILVVGGLMLHGEARPRWLLPALRARYLEIDTPADIVLFDLRRRPERSVSGVLRRIAGLGGRSRAS